MEVVRDLSSSCSVDDRMLDWCGILYTTCYLRLTYGTILLAGYPDHIGITISYSDKLLDVYTSTIAL